MLAAILLPLVYVVGIAVTILIGSRVTRQDSDVPFIAIIALMWPLTVPLVLTLSGSMWAVETAQRWWKRRLPYR